jgi:hypothetical protein
MYKEIKAQINSSAGEYNNRMKGEKFIKRSITGSIVIAQPT